MASTVIPLPRQPLKNVNHIPVGLKKEEQPVTVTYYGGVLSITSSVDAEKNFTYGFRCVKAEGLAENDYEECKWKIESKEFNG